MTIEHQRKPTARHRAGVGGGDLQGRQIFAGQIAFEGDHEVTLGAAGHRDLAISAQRGVQGVTQRRCVRRVFQPRGVVGLAVVFQAQGVTAGAAGCQLQLLHFRSTLTCQLLTTETEAALLGAHADVAQVHPGQLAGELDQVTVAGAGERAVLAHLHIVRGHSEVQTGIGGIQQPHKFAGQILDRFCRVLRPVEVEGRRRQGRVAGKEQPEALLAEFFLEHHPVGFVLGYTRAVGQGGDRGAEAGRPGGGVAQQDQTLQFIDARVTGVQIVHPHRHRRRLVPQGLEHQLLDLVDPRVGGPGLGHRRGGWRCREASRDVVNQGAGQIANELDLVTVVTVATDRYIARADTGQGFEGRCQICKDVSVGAVTLEGHLFTGRASADRQGTRGLNRDTQSQAGIHLGHNLGNGVQLDALVDVHQHLLSLHRQRVNASQAGAAGRGLQGGKAAGGVVRVADQRQTEVEVAQ